MLAFVAGVAAPTTFTEVRSVWAIGQDATTLTTMPTSAVPRTRSASGPSERPHLSLLTAWLL